MKKLNVDTLQQRRAQLSRRNFIRSVPTITTVLLASQAAPLFAASTDIFTAPEGARLYEPK